VISIDGEKVDLLEQNWDVLIIIDATRYDVFEDTYKNILHKEGVLKKAKTFAGCTFDWMNSNLNNKDCSNIIYIDPIIMFENYVPQNNFFKVEKVWETKWDYEYGTILPESITDSALELMKKHKDKRFIVHYHQPHPPILLPNFLKIRTRITTPDKVLRRVDKEDENPAKDIPHFIQGNMRRFLGSENAWNILIKLGIEPLDGAGQMYKHLGKDEMIRGYKENLKLVLKDINRIIDSQNKKIVITSDHSYNYDRSRKKLKKRYVPWYEVHQ
jgi:hypothetical protein